MQSKLFTIRDTKAEFYGPPFVKKTPGEAERDFKSLVNDPKSNVHLYPEDYDLFMLGTYDDLTGKMELLPSPQHVVKAINLKATTNERLDIV